MKFTFAPEARPLDGYTIKRAIHRGGFGEVYYALSDAGKEVALKLLNNNLEIELRGVRQCLNLKHPNLVTIFDIRQDADDDHWVVMEFVSGRGLYETLRDHPSGMPIQDVLTWMEGITAGLSFLHDRGIVHRDLKPANVFRDQAGVKIGDVGLSKYISESRRSAQTQSVGTVYYMAPEVARGRYGREVDVYALGIMLFEMITGRVPFDGQTTAEILMKHLTAEPDVSVLPEALRPVITSALEKDPDKRTSSVEEVEQGFRLAVSGSNIQSPVPIKLTAALIADANVSNAAPVEVPRTSGKFRDADTLVDIDTTPSSGQASKAESGALATMWNSLPAPLQWVIGGAVALLVIESGMLRPVAVGGMIGGAAYLGYQLLTTFGVAAGTRDERTTPAAASSAPSPALARSAKSQRQAPQVAHPARKTATVLYTPETTREISKRQRATDMSTSVSVSLAASALVTAAVFMTTDLLRDVSQAVYFGTVTMLAAWSLIVPSKFWEGRSGDSFSRRLVLGGIGLGVGVIAAWLPQYLLIPRAELFHGGGSDAQISLGRLSLADGSGYPTMTCFMIYFAALFAARRWWWQVDSFRKSRFRVSSALFTLLVGVVVASILEQYAFPDALGATWALAISAVVQLSAGWTPAEDRRLRPSRQKTEPQTAPAPSLAGHEATSLNQV